MTKLLQTEKRSLVTPLLLLILLLNAVVVASQVSLWGSLLQLRANRQVFIQTSDGEVVQAIANPDPTYRTPETIKTFAEAITVGLYQWQHTDVEQAQGKGLAQITVDGKNLSLPMTMLHASYALTDDLQIPVLQELAQSIPSSVLNSEESFVVVIDSVSEPIALREGAWEVEVLGFQKRFRAAGGVNPSIPIRKRLVIEPIPYPRTSQESSPLETVIAQSRSYGLQITELHELE